MIAIALRRPELPAIAFELPSGETALAAKDRGLFRVLAQAAWAGPGPFWRRIGMRIATKRLIKSGQCLFPLPECAGCARLTRCDHWYARPVSRPPALFTRCLSVRARACAKRSAP